MISFATALQGCRLEPLKVDPCVIYPDLKSCFAVPLNQPGKPEYDRPLNPSDVCLTADEYVKLQQFSRDVLERCGDRCEPGANFRPVVPSVLEYSVPVGW